MNKEELIDNIQLRCAGGDLTPELISKYHPNLISLNVDQVFTDLIFQAYALGGKTGDYSMVDNYCLTYVFPIAYDSAREQYYSELNPSPVPLPDNYGIRLVCPPKDQNMAFAPIDNNASNVFNELEVSFVNFVPAYSYEGSRLYYDDNFPKGLQNIMVKQVVSFSSLRRTDTVFIPGGQNTAFIDKVVSMMVGVPMPDVQGSNQNSKQV